MGTMETKKRKPLADISNRTSRSKTPISIFKSVSSSANQNLFSESSNGSVASVGSSSNVNSARTNLGGLGRQAAEKDRKEENTDVPIDNPSHVEKKKDKRKVIAMPFSSSMIMTKANFPVSSQTRIEKREDKGMAAAAPFSSLVLLRKADILVSDRTPTEKRIEKGKAIAVPLGSILLEEENDELIFNPAHAEKRKNEGKAMVHDLSVPGEKGDDQFCYQTSVEDFGKDPLLPYTLSHENAKIRSPGINSASSSMGTGEVTERGEGIARHSVPSNVKRREREKEIVLPLIEKERDKGKHLNVFSSIEKLWDKGKESSDTATIIRQPQRVKSERGKTVAGASICPPQRKTRNIQNDLNEVGDDESSNLWIDPHLKSRKEMRDKGKEFSETVTISRQPQRVKSERGKNGAGASNCLPARKARNIQNDLDNNGDDKSSNSWTNPHPKFRKKTRTKIEPAYELPEDFIKQQQAYFKEIDEFELLVEEASQSD